MSRKTETSGRSRNKESQESFDGATNAMSSTRPLASRIVCWERSDRSPMPAPPKVTIATPSRSYRPAGFPEQTATDRAPLFFFRPKVCAVELGERLLAQNEPSLAASHLRPGRLFGHDSTPDSWNVFDDAHRADALSDGRTGWSGRMSGFRSYPVSVGTGTVESSA